MPVPNYKSKVVSAEEAVKVIKSNDRVYLHANSAFPDVLVDAMCDRYKELENVKVAHLTTFHKAPYVDPKMTGHFVHEALFTAGNVRKAVNEGRADCYPVFLSEIGWLMELGRMPIDVCMLHLSPPDEHGYCSYGVSNEVSKIAAENAKVIIAQINPQMPRVLGDNFIHVSKLKHIVEVDRPLLDVPMVDANASAEEKDIYRRIAEHISSLISDGATLQMGIGAIPDAVLPFLKEKKDLGIHTEMFSDGLIELIDLGVVNGEKKTFLPNKVVASFVIGTKTVFDYIHNNPLIEFRSSKFVNDPVNISRNDNMVSINSAIQVDLSGQVCSDSMGTRIFSGFGGQLDFVRGAMRSKGGRSILAFPSTTKNNTISKIVPMLTEGSGVVTTRADVMTIITEYGIADLYGKTLRERTKLLIDIAHPDFREELERKAKEFKWLW
ncbi:MAG TPA: acetyl-CoA hydrolase/transferase C-terminal domain-containing protein [Ignavibacteria bacterium]|nr:acetyl-CoA hydrolase/transferase C-terminal domain-containing protein [Ignavibacteria bacterium]